MEADTHPGHGAGPGLAETLSGPISVGTVSELPQILDLTQAQPLRDAMLARQGNTPCILDAAAVERMSTPCAQVLLAAARGADALGIPFTIRNASATFRSALTDLGLQPEFMKWMV